MPTSLPARRRPLPPLWRLLLANLRSRLWLLVSLLRLLVAYVLLGLIMLSFALRTRRIVTLAVKAAKKLARDR